MPRTENVSPLLAKEGLNGVIELYSASLPNIWKDIVKVKTCKDNVYRTLSQGDMGPATEMNQAQGVTYDDFDTPFVKDWTPLKRGIGFAIATEVAESDKYGVIAKRARLMMKSMSKTIEADAASFLNLATSTSFTGPDNVALASASHPIDGAVDTNIVTSNPVLSYSALETAVQMLQVQKSHRGDPMMFMGPFRLFVPAQLSMLAARLTETDRYPGTANNDKNVVRGKIAKVVVSPYFTSTTAWGLRSDDDDEHGLVIVERRAQIADSKYDFDKDVDKYKLTKIWCKAHDDWRGFVYSSGAGA